MMNMRIRTTILTIIFCMVVFSFGATTSAIVPNEQITNTLDSQHQPPMPPVPIINYKPTLQQVNKIITYDASESYHPDNNPDVEEKIIEYLWDFDNDNEFEVSGKIVNHTWYTEGDHHVSLKVIGNTGLNDTLTELIFVYQPTTITIDDISTSSGKVSSTIENTGQGTCDVYWTIKVTGGIFDYVDFEEYDQDQIYAGEELKISTSETILGFGFLDISIDIEATIADNVSTNTSGLIFGSWIFIVE